jgi:2-methylcitrate synthase
MGTIEPENLKKENYYGAEAIAVRLVAMFGPALLYWYHFHKSGGKVRLNPNTGDSDSVALNFVKLMNYGEHSH